MLVVRLAGSAAIVLAILSVDLRPRVTTIVQPTAHTTTTIVLPMPSITTIEVPVAPTITTAKQGRCPAPRTDDDVPRVVPPELPARVDHVMVAPTNARWVAAWSTTAVYVSADAGATFSPVLAGTADVRAVAFDCFGRALVLREDRLGIHDTVTHGETWHRIPGMTSADQFDAEARIASGGPDLVVFARFGDGEKPHLAASIDDGASWQHRAIDAYWEGARGSTVRERADGTLDVMFPQPDCMSTELWWGRTKIDPATGAIDPVVADGEHAYGEGAELYAGKVALAGRYARRRDETWKPIDGLPDDANAAAIAGELPALLVDDSIYRVVDGVAHRMKVDRGDAQPIHIDRAGRVWALNCGRLYVLSPAPGPDHCGPDI